MVGEQFEEEGIRLAGAGGQVNAFGIYAVSAFGIIACDRFARDGQSSRRGLVKHRRGLSERAENLFSRIVEPGPSRIRFGQVENSRAGSLLLLDQPREPVRFQTPFESFGKHAEERIRNKRK